MDKGPSLWVSIGMILLTLVLVVGLVGGGYFLFIRENEEPGGNVSSEVPRSTAAAKPTESPKPEPTATAVPTMAPTAAPTMAPTAAPTKTPAPVQPESEVTQKPADVEAGHIFTEVNETVTAKEATNLRNMPSQGEESKVMLTLYNGQVALRIGISDSGWSKVSYQGEIYYAVSGYLTTDLTAPTPVPEDDGIQTVFTECNEMVAPKIEVNLRTLPSVTNPDSVVVVKLPYGTQVKRTGINTDVGWSRVEYEGQVLYCVSSYVFVVEQ